MRKLTKAICVVIATLTIAISVAGCKNNAATSASSTPSSPQDYKGTISVWTWQADYFNSLVKLFNQTYPNVTVNVTAVQWGDYLTKFETAKAAGTKLPDIALGESFWWGTMLTFKDTFVDLSTLGFKKDDLIPAVSALSTNTSNKFVAMPVGLGIGCIWYRKDLSKQYLGTDDAATLQSQFNTWDDFVNAGQTVKTQSSGKVFLLPNTTEFAEALVASTKEQGKSYINGNTLEVKQNMTTPYALLQKALSSGYIAKVSGASYDSSWSQGNAIFFPSANWREGQIPSWDKDGKGRWGVLLPPGGAYFRGGTAALISDNHNKQEATLAALFLENSLFTKEGVSIGIDNGNMSAVKEAQTNNWSNGVDDYFGIDINSMMSGWLSNLQPPKYGPYDSTIETVLDTAATNMEQSGQTADQVLATAVTDIQAKCDAR
jgi:multiple sugar transport system substrate-binding protein